MSKRSRRNRKRNRQKGVSMAAAPEPTVRAIEVIVPSGHPNDWNDDEWDQFELALSQLTEKEQDRVWLEIYDQWELDDTDPFDNAKYEKDVYEMTEAEWLGTAGALGVELTPKDLEDVDPVLLVKHTIAKGKADAAAKPTPADRDAAMKQELSECSCEGPGSKANKWDTHVVSCLGLMGTPFYIPSAMSPWDTGYKKKSCQHRQQEFVLEDGLKLYASAAYDYAPGSGPVDLGVYFASSWVSKIGASVLSTPGLQGPWTTDLIDSHDHDAVFVECPDRDKPHLSVPEMATLVDWVLDCADQGLRVETGCVGGHGRTGMMLACALAVQGVPPKTAIERVWETYCTSAVESMKQVFFVIDVYEHRHGTGWDAELDPKEWNTWINQYFGTGATATTYPAPGGKSPLTSAMSVLKIKKGGV